MKKYRGISAITILIIVSILVIIIILTLFLLPKNKAGRRGPNIPVFNPSPSANTANFSPVKLTQDQKTRIGSTTDTQIQQLPNLLNKQTLADGSTQYNFQSTIKDRPNIIITQNGVAIYEKDLLLDASSSSPLKMSSLISKYGQPDSIARGSSYYGFSISTYIYASKGFAAIGNTYADKVYELQTFDPMSVDQYKSLYGQDINPNASPAGEGITPQQDQIFNFKSSLPYVTSYMGIKYERDADTVTVVIDQSHKDEGDQAFKDYLAKFGITDQSEISNLKVVYR